MTPHKQPLLPHLVGAGGSFTQIISKKEQTEYIRHTALEVNSASGPFDFNSLASLTSIQLGFLL